MSLISSSQPVQSVPETKPVTTKAPVQEEKPVKKEEVKEEEEEMDMGGLFDWFWNKIILNLHTFIYFNLIHQLIIYFGSNEHQIEWMALNGLLLIIFFVKICKMALKKS